MEEEAPFLPEAPFQVRFYRALLLPRKMCGRGYCGHNFEALKATISGVLASVSKASIRGFYSLAPRAMDTGGQHGTEEFKQNAHKCEYKSKWAANMLLERKKGKEKSQEKVALLRLKISLTLKVWASGLVIVGNPLWSYFLSFLFLHY